jgi:hypothetical protein
MFITSAAAVGGGMNRSSSISMHKSPSLKIKRTQPIDIYPNGSPETGCLCFPITKVGNCEDISGKSY